MFKKVFVSLFILFSLALNAYAEEPSENCTMVFYNNGEEITVEKSYDEIAPVMDRLFLNSFDAGLNLLMSDTSVNDMKNVGTHIEIILEKPRVFPKKTSHMEFLAYKTYVVKDGSDVNSLPIKKIFLTYQPIVQKIGVGTISDNPKIINIEQNRIRVITGTESGYGGSPEFAFGSDNDYNLLLMMFKE